MSPFATTVVDASRFEEIEEIVTSYLDHTIAPLAKARPNALAALNNTSAPHTSTARAATCAASARTARTSHDSELREIRALLPLTPAEHAHAVSVVRAYRSPR